MTSSERAAFNERVREALRELDGTTTSAVALLTGLTRDQIAKLGGIREEHR